MAKHTLLLADGLRLPANLVTESVAIIAKRRAGKSTTARRLTEQLYHAKQQCVVVDPKGDWWGLRYDRSGKHPGLTFIILGGEHGDVPLEPGAASGEIVARLVVEERVNIILDLSNFRKPQIAPFMTAFMETLYRLKAAERYRTPVMIVIDEADVIAPQKQSREGQAEMIAAADDLVRRGGQRGIGVMMITQRSAVLNKDLLTQIGVLIVLRTIAPQDRKAIDLWIDAHGDEEQRRQLSESIPTLHTGEAWIWAPGWPTGDGIFQRRQILLPETFDSSFTPDASRRNRRLTNPASIDLGALSQRMADTIAHAKENDPRELKQINADLKREIAQLKLKADTLSKTPAPKPPEHRPALTKRDLARLAKLLTSSRAIVKIGRAWVDAGDGLVKALERVTGTPQAAQTAAGPASLPNGHVNYRAPVVPPRATSSLPPGEQAVLTAAAQFGGRGASRGTITLMSGFKKSSRDAYIARLRGKGLLDLSGDVVIATPKGIAEIGPVDPVPTGAAAIDYWRTTSNLPPGEQVVFRVVADHAPAEVTREAIQAAVQLKRSSTNAYISRLAQRLLITTNRNGVTLAPAFYA
jgi:hypothetical protein